MYQMINVVMIWESGSHCEKKKMEIFISSLFVKRFGWGHLTASRLNNTRVAMVTPNLDGGF